MRVSIVTNLRQKNNAEVIVLAGGYISNMTNNPKFGSNELINQVGTVQAKSNELSGLMNRTLYEGKSTDVAIARDNLDREITILCNMVEAVANSSSTPDGERISIVHSAGMDIKTQGVRSKRVFSVSNGDLSGMVKLLAEGGAQAHEWQYTADVDKFTNRVAAITTTKSSTEISGLGKGDYAFFHKAIFSDKVVDWEGPIVHTVV
ncbi:MAG: hypothetical protein Q8928_03785 [Bacteroidota bacterium]|nr:hypothetical protein [Bacteroidota bacterium]